MSDYYKNICFWDLKLRANLNYAPKNNLKYYFNKIDEKIHSRSTEQLESITRWYTDKKRKIFVRDVTVYDDRAEVLFCYCDANIPTISIVNLDTNEQNDVNLNDREGRPETVHMIVDLIGNEGNYKVIVEEGREINRTKLSVYLRFLVDVISKEHESHFVVQDPSAALDDNGNPIMRKYKHTADFNGHLSKKFTEMLDGGRLTGLCLEDYKIQSQGFAERDEVEINKSQISLRVVDGKSWYENSFDKIKSALRLSKENNYDMLRISFRSQDNTPHTVRIASDTEYEELHDLEIIGEGFIKKNRIHFTSFVPEGCIRINEDVISKMRRLWG
jgi:hypothetical protein